MKIQSSLYACVGYLAGLNEGKTTFRQHSIEMNAFNDFRLKNIQNINLFAF